MRKNSLRRETLTSSRRSMLRRCSSRLPQRWASRVLSRGSKEWRRIKADRSRNGMMIVACGHPAQSASMFKRRAFTLWVEFRSAWRGVLLALFASVALMAAALATDVPASGGPNDHVIVREGATGFQGGGGPVAFPATTLVVKLPDDWAVTRPRFEG